MVEKIKISKKSRHRNKEFVKFLIAALFGYFLIPIIVSQLTIQPILNPLINILGFSGGIWIDFLIFLKKTE